MKVSDVAEARALADTIWRIDRVSEAYAEQPRVGIKVSIEDGCSFYLSRSNAELSAAFKKLIELARRDINAKLNDLGVDAD